MNVAVCQTSTVPSERLIPECLPPLMPPPQPTWRPHWLIAPLLLPLALIFPRRLSGPLGAASVGVALWVHVVGLAVGTYAVFFRVSLYTLTNGTETSQISDYLDAGRYVFRNAWQELMLSSGDSAGVYNVVVLAGLTEFGLLAAAFILMPWSIAGESRWRAFWRSLKLVYWSTAAILAVPIIVNQAALYGLMAIGAGPLISRYEIFDLEGFLIPLGVVWSFYLYLTLGDRYSGFGEGRLFKSRALACVGCGYELTYLPESSHCPECNLAISVSLPECRARLPFAAARSLWGRLRTFGHAAWQATQAQTFGCQWRIYESRLASRQFMLLVALVVGIAVALCSGLGDPRFRDQMFQLSEANDALGVVIHLFKRFLWGCGGTLVIILIGGSLVSGLGFSAPERKTTVFAFASSWLLWVAAAALAGFVWYWGIEEHLMLTGGISVAYPRVLIPYKLMLSMVGFIPAAAFLLLWPLHAHKMLRATRFANA